MWFLKRGKPKIFILSGLPGSGKTTQARKWVGAEEGRLLIDDPKNYDLVIETLNRTSAREVMICDPMLVLRERREEFQKRVLGFEIEWQFLETPKEECLRRITLRGRAGDIDVIPDVHYLAENMSLPTRR